MFRKTLTALVTVATLSFAGAAFAAAPATTPTAKTQAKITGGKKMKKSAKPVASTATSTKTAAAPAAQQVDMSKQKAQPRVAKKGQRTSKKALRAAHTSAAKPVAK